MKNNPEYGHTFPTANEFRNKLEDFLNRTVGESWDWFGEDEGENSLSIRTLSVWGLEEEKEVA